MDDAVSFFGFVTAEAKRILLNDCSVLAAFVSLKFTGNTAETRNVGLFAKVIERERKTILQEE